MRTKLTLWLAGVMLALVPTIAAAQDVAAKIHGHVQDPANAPIVNGQVILTTDGKTALYTFTTDQNGDYKGEGIKPGTYFITLYATPGKAVDRFDNVKFTSGEDLLQDFDLSRADYVAKLPPEQRKALEEAKKKNAEINKENAERRQAERPAQAGARRQRGQEVRRCGHCHAAGHDLETGCCCSMAGAGNSSDGAKEVRRCPGFAEEGAGSRYEFKEAES